MKIKNINNGSQIIGGNGNKIVISNDKEIENTTNRLQINFAAEDIQTMQSYLKDNKIKECLEYISLIYKNTLPTELIVLESWYNLLVKQELMGTIDYHKLGEEYRNIIYRLTTLIKGE
jgi:hypothetical protein